MNRTELINRLGNIVADAEDATLDDVTNLPIAFGRILGRLDILVATLRDEQAHYDEMWDAMNEAVAK
jgi:translation elongation factor EF-1beta